MRKINNNMDEMRKLLNLMESATEEEVSESFFSPKVSQEEFYKRLNDMVEIFKDHDKVVDLQSERIKAAMEMIESQQEIIDVMSKAINETRESLNEMTKNMRMLTDIVKNNPPGSRKPDDDPIH